MKGNQKIIIVSIVAAVVIAALCFLFLQSRNQMQEMVDVLTEEKSTLIIEYQDLYSDFDSLRTNNEDLNQRLELERERIAQLKEEIKTVKATNARRIKELQAELTSTRAIMRTFVRQVDSLNQINVKLTKENTDMRKQVDKVRQSNNELSRQNEALSEKVEIASRLEATNIQAIGLNFKEKKATSAKKVSKIKVSFTLKKNITAKVGMRTVFLRLTRPDGQLLMHSADDVFAFESNQINFSARRDVEYGGEDTDSHVVYTADVGELMGGQYEIELFCGGDRIGSGTFSLKN